MDASTTSSKQLQSHAEVFMNNHFFHKATEEGCSKKIAEKGIHDGNSLWSIPNHSIHLYFAV